jgi:hypothetical protein
LGHLWLRLNRKILDVALLRLRFCAGHHNQIRPKSERDFAQVICDQPLIFGHHCTGGFDPYYLVKTLPF